MRDVDKEKILDLYFNELYSISQILEFFHNKYTYAEVRKLVLSNIK